MMKKNFFIRLDTPYARYISDMKYFWKNELEFIEIPEEFINKNKILQITIGAPTETEIDKIIEEFSTNPYVKIENRYCVKLKEKSLWLINIINTSASKGNAISELCKYLKIDLKDSIGFGDDLNDIAMMKTVGLSVAMGNAHPEIKKIAKTVIEDNTKASIAEFIYEIIEKNN